MVLAWDRGSDGLKTELPGEIAAPFSGTVVSSMSTSTRMHTQKVYPNRIAGKRQAAMGRVWKETQTKGSGNVEAAHTIPVAEGKILTKMLLKRVLDYGVCMTHLME